MIWPAGVMRPMRSAVSVNHRLPSGPAAMSNGWLPGVIPVANSTILARRGDPTDLIAVDRIDFGEPNVPVRPGG